MITVTVDKIDGSDITNDIRCIDPAMIVPGSIRPITVNTAGSACIMEMLTWDGNIQNYRAVRWTLTDTYTTIVNSLNLVSVTLAKVNGESVTADLRGLDPSMIVPGTMRPLTANNTATAAVMSVLTWDNNTFTRKAVEWQLSGTYAATKTAIEAVQRAANQFAPPYAAATGTDTYTLTLVPAITDYTTGVPFYFQVANTNTGASTLNVNGLGAKALVKGASTDLADSDLIVDKIYQGVYDGTSIQVTELSPTPVSTISFLKDGAANIINKTYTLAGGTVSIIPDDTSMLTANTIVIVNYHLFGSGAAGVNYAVDINPGVGMSILSFDTAGVLVATDDSILKVTVFNVS